MNHPRAIHVVKTAISLRMRVAQTFLQERLGERASSAGAELAAQVDALVRAEKLGYYPALDYFSSRDGIDRGLLAVLEEAARFVREHVEQEVRARLWPAFSHVRVVNTQSPAFALPGVRPGQPEALVALARHYTPSLVKIDVVVSSLKKGEGGQGAERAAAQQARWWLRECFESVEVSDARAVAE